MACLQGVVEPSQYAEHHENAGQFCSAASLFIAHSLKLRGEAAGLDMVCALAERAVNCVRQMRPETPESARLELQARLSCYIYPSSSSPHVAPRLPGYVLLL